MASWFRALPGRIEAYSALFCGGFDDLYHIALRHLSLQSLTPLTFQEKTGIYPKGKEDVGDEPYGNGFCRCCGLGVCRIFVLIRCVHDVGVCTMGHDFHCKSYQPSDWSQHQSALHKGCQEKAEGKTGACDCGNYRKLWKNQHEILFTDTFTREIQCAGDSRKFQYSLGSDKNHTGIFKADTRHFSLWNGSSSRGWD